MTQGSVPSEIRVGTNQSGKPSSLQLHWRWLRDWAVQEGNARHLFHPETRNSGQYGSLTGYSSYFKFLQKIQPTGMNL